MEPNIATYVFDGDTFVGNFAVSDHGGRATVTVWYKHIHLAAPVGDMRTEHVARSLLCSLVSKDVEHHPATGPRPSEPMVLGTFAGADFPAMA